MFINLTTVHDTTSVMKRKKKNAKIVASFHAPRLAAQSAIRLYAVPRDTERFCCYYNIVVVLLHWLQRRANRVQDISNFSTMTYIYARLMQRTFIAPRQSSQEKKTARFPPIYQYFIDINMVPRYMFFFLQSLYDFLIFFFVCKLNYIINL